LLFFALGGLDEFLKKRLPLLPVGMPAWFSVGFVSVLIVHWNKLPLVSKKKNHK
jgi:hypothetical protein